MIKAIRHTAGIHDQPLHPALCIKRFQTADFVSPHFHALEDITGEGGMEGEEGPRKIVIP